MAPMGEKTSANTKRNQSVGTDGEDQYSGGFRDSQPNEKSGCPKKPVRLAVLGGWCLGMVLGGVGSNVLHSGRSADRCEVESTNWRC